MKTIILDCGGVMVYPRMGDWNVPFSIAAVLGERAKDIHTSRYLMAHRQSAEWLDESRKVADVEEERRLRREYIRAMNMRMDWHMSPSEIALLTDDFTDNPRRYGLFEDVDPWLKRWRGRYRLGMLSDAMPSILGFMRQFGVYDLFDAAVISTHVGAIKPDPRMYEAILAALGDDPADCVFVDDRMSNLEGAVAAGMKAVQMTRPAFLPDPVWDGPRARSFEELNGLLEKGL